MKIKLSETEKKIILKKNLFHSFIYFEPLKRHLLGLLSALHHPTQTETHHYYYDYHHLHHMQHIIQYITSSSWCLKLKLKKTQNCNECQAIKYKKKETLQKSWRFSLNIKKNNKTTLQHAYATYHLLSLLWQKTAVPLKKELSNI